LNRLVFDQNPIFWQYAAKSLGIDGFGQCKTISVMDEKHIIAVVVYSRWDGYQCEVAVVANKPTWLSRTNIRIMLGYPFNQLGCKRISVICRADNFRAISLAERLGFKRETSDEGLRAYCSDGTNAHIYGLLKEECHWIRKNG